MEELRRQTLWKKRQLSENALYPYQWVINYTDGSAIAQFDGLRRNTSRDIDKARVRNMIILNHPASPIVVEPPFPSPPDEVIIKCTVDMDMRLGQEPKVASWVCKFGYRYRAEFYYLIMDPFTHRVWTTDVDD